MNLYQQFYHSTLDMKTLSQLQRFVTCYRPHGEIPNPKEYGMERKPEETPTWDQIKVSVYGPETRSWHCMEVE